MRIYAVSGNARYNGISVFSAQILCNGFAIHRIKKKPDSIKEIRRKNLK